MNYTTLPEAPASAQKFERTKLQGCAILAVGLVFALGVARQWNPLNGSSTVIYWVWTWRGLNLLNTAAFMFAPFVPIAWVLWKAERNSSPVHPSFSLGFSLALLALSNYLLQILGILADPRGIQLVREIVASPAATSYFTDAMSIQHPLEWLAHFQNAKLNLHAMTHPPGPILFYYFFYKLLGPAAGALIGGCAVGLLGSAGAAVMYLFAGLWTPDGRTRLTASAFYALLPALTVFFPEFDQVYPILSMLLIFFWVRALGASPGRARYAWCAGAVLFLASFFAYNLLTTGAFLAYFGLYWLWRRNWAWSAWATLLRTSGIASATFAGLYAALWLGTGYHPVASFLHGMSNQALLQWRPYFPFPLTDPYDFLLGAGIVVLPILLFHLQRLLRHWDAKRTDLALTLIGLATILTVDVSGLLRGETARVWLFLQPLLVVPAALELARFSWPWRLSIFALQWWIVACLRARMSFINP